MIERWGRQVARLSAQGQLSSFETNGELQIANLCFHISKNTFRDKHMRTKWGIGLVRGGRGPQGCPLSTRYSSSPYECRVLDVLENNSPRTALSKQSSSPQCNPAGVSPKHGTTHQVLHHGLPMSTQVPHQQPLCPDTSLKDLAYIKNTVRAFSSSSLHLLLPRFLEAWSAASPSK